jgi:predicted transposase YbfD/YdcC
MTDVARFNITEMPTDQVPEEILDKSKNKRNKKHKVAPKLGQLFEIIQEHDLEDAENIEITVLESMKTEFGKVYDPRNPSYVTFKLADILIIVLLAVLANNNTWYEIEIFAYSHKRFLSKLLDMENETMPTDDTYRLVISHIDMNLVYGCVVRLLINKIDCAIEHHATSSVTSEPDITPFDGKASRSSGRVQTFDQQVADPLFTLNAFSTNYGMNLNQSFINAKTNEIPEMPLLIKRMNITGSIVTCDALNTQIDTAAAIIGGGGMYVMPVKGNHKNLHNDLKSYFDEEMRNQLEGNAARNPSYKITVEKEHGGTAIRQYYISTNIWNLYHIEEWAGVTAIGMARRIFRSNKPGVATLCHDRYYILGGVSDVETFARSARKHWHVENKCHWQLDFTMKDDANKTMVDTGAEGLQLMKKAALNVLNVARVLFRPYDSLNYIRSSICQGFETQILRILSILDVDSLIEANRSEFDLTDVN